MARCGKPRLRRHLVQLRRVQQPHAYWPQRVRTLLGAVYFQHAMVAGGRVYIPPENVEPTQEQSDLALAIGATTAAGSLETYYVVVQLKQEQKQRQLCQLQVLWVELTFHLHQAEVSTV